MVKLNKIYTRTGDDGTSGLVDGSRLAKSHARFEAIGAVDEANSAIGFAIIAITQGDHAAALQKAQNDLFDLGADLATPGDDFTPSPMVLRMIPAQVAWLETQIDAVNANLATNLKAYVTDHWFQPLLWEQLKAVGITLVLAVVGTIVIAYVTKALVGLRPSEEVEISGLDIAEHGEEGYTD